MIYQDPKPRKPIKDPEYLKWVRSERCLFCGEYVAGNAHHVRFGHSAGIGTKPDDYRTIPLCSSCHDDAHNARVPAHVGREEILEWMLKSVIEYFVEKGD